MTKDEFYEMLNKSDVEVTFTKVTDGSTRVMRCTSNVPVDERLEAGPKRVSRSDNIVTVYDTESKGWRSFHADRIIEANPLDTRFGLLQEEIHA